MSKRSDGKEDLPDGESITPTIWTAIFDDASAKDRLRFFRILFRFLVTFHIAWACGWLSVIGLNGFAWAKDVQAEVDNTHAEILKPINAKLAELDNKVEETLRIQKKLLIGQISAQLRDLNRMRCRTTDEATRQRIEADMEDAQVVYRSLAGERYQLTSCKDL